MVVPRQHRRGDLIFSVGEVRRERLAPRPLKRTILGGKMSDPTIREPEQIRRDCAAKLRAVEVSGQITAILGCLLDEN